MIRRLMILCSVVGLTVMAPGAAGAAAPTIVAPSQLHWKPGTGPLRGAQVVQVFGDASKPGAFVTRIRFPDGIGDTMDTSKMIGLPAGSFVSIPPNGKRRYNHPAQRRRPVVDAPRVALNA